MKQMDMQAGIRKQSGHSPGFESRRWKACGGLPEHETAEQKKGFCGTLRVPRGGALPLFLKE